jgi:hypothetical protein
MKKIIVMLAVVMLGVACRGSVPVYTVLEKTVTVSPATTMEQAILAGGSRKGWTMRRVTDGLMTGTLFVRTHQVVVNIPYTANTYSVQYADSKNMSYYAKKNKIHPKYNQWVRNLDLAITRAAQAPEQNK